MELFSREVRKQMVVLGVGLGIASRVPAIVSSFRVEGLGFRVLQPDPKVASQPSPNPLSLKTQPGTLFTYSLMGSTYYCLGFMA